MKFTLEIDCDSAAFAPVHDDASEAERYRAAAEEVRDILRDLLSRAGTDGPSMARLRSGFLRDANGNRCGQWSLHESEPEALDAMLARHARELAELDAKPNKLDALRGAVSRYTCEGGADNKQAVIEAAWAFFGMGE